MIALLEGKSGVHTLLNSLFLFFIDTIEGDSPESSEENHETDAIVEVIPEPEDPANEPLLQGTEQT